MFCLQQLVGETDEDSRDIPSNASDDLNKYNLQSTLASPTSADEDTVQEEEEIEEQEEDFDFLASMKIAEKQRREAIRESLEEAGEQEDVDISNSVEESGRKKPLPKQFDMFAEELDVSSKDYDVGRKLYCVHYSSYLLSKWCTNI